MLIFFREFEPLYIYIYIYIYIKDIIFNKLRVIKIKDDNMTSWQQNAWLSCRVLTYAVEQLFFICVYGCLLGQHMFI
jgi:hypothetical protein